MHIVAIKIVICRLTNRLTAASAFALVLLFSASRSLSAEVVPPDRLTDWSYAGVRGGIPERTTIYTTLNPGATASQIQTAINNCPSGQVVMLNAGTYSLSSGFKVSKDGVTLRGATNSAGEPTTIMEFSSGAGGWGLIDFSKTGYPANNWGSVSTANVSSGLTRGSSSVTLASSPSGLQVGQILVFDQTEDGTLVNVSGSVEGGGIWGRNGRYYMQMVRVTAISGSTVTFEPPIYGSYWNSSQSPQAYWFGSGLSQIVSMSGIENIKVNRVSGGGGTYNLHLGPAINCWVKNVWSTQAASGHVRTGWALFCEIRDCYFTKHDSVASATYSAYITFSSSTKLENNMMYETPCALGLIASSGCVISYNFATNFPYTQSNWLPECMMTHGGHVYFNLFEGNYVPSFWSDFTHGNASYNVFARNRVTGWESGKTGSTRPINLQENQNSYTEIGNLLGTAGYHTSYDSTGDKSIYNVDSGSAATIIRKGNWNTANNAVPSSESLGSDTVSTSYLYSSKPAWFGNRPWPPFNTSSPSAAVATNLPAGYRYYYNSVPPSGGGGGGTANQPPTASASASTNTGVAPLAISFSSAGSSDPEGVTLSYNWNFGDGGTSTSANPSHTYAAAGSYTAKLTVSDGVNNAVSSNISIVVTAAAGNQSPVAVASATPLSGSAPLAVSFSSAGSSDPEGTPLTYSWTFGDGGTSTSANPGHTYSSAGNYVARLTVSDGTNSAQSAAISVAVVTPGSGLVAAYGFEEGGGTAAVDASGAGNSGTVNSAVWVQGKYGKALSFNGTSSSVTISHSASLNLMTGMTLEAWVNPTATGGWREIIYKDIDIYFLLGSTPQGLPSMGGTFASTNVYGPALALNTWTHLAATYDGATMRFYVNGVQASSRAQTGGILASTLPLTIGGDTTYGQYWSGLIDEVRIYNRALSASEIQSDMTSSVLGTADPVPSQPQGLRILTN